MTERPTYLVLTESPTVNLVAIRFGGQKPWLRVVAVFPAKDRAESYAEMENTFVADELVNSAWPADLKYDAPAVGDPGSALTRVLAGRKGRPAIGAVAEIAAPKPKPAVKAKKARGRPRIAGKKAAGKARPGTGKRATGLSADDRRRRVRELWPDHTPAQIAERLGISTVRVYQIGKELRLEKRPVAKPEPKKTPGTRPAKPAPAAEREPKPAKAAAPAPLLPAPPPPAVARPAPAQPSGNGSDAGSYSRSGVTVVSTPGNEAIGFKGKSAPLTAGQAQLAAILLRAAPAPVGRKFIADSLYGAGVAGEDADMRLANTARALTGLLPEVGLALNDLKGIGLSLSGVA